MPLVFATFQNIAKRYPPPFNWIERCVLERADAMIAFGETARVVLETRRPRAARVRSIPPGVDTQRFATGRERPRGASAESLGWDDATPVVGFLGRFVPEKGIGWLDGRARRRWRIRGARCSSVRVRSNPSCAPGPRGGRTVSRSKPTVRHDEVPQWLNAMDMLCAPSLTTGKMA